MVISNTFTPFFGFVEDVMDPEEVGRVRVRVTGYHTENKGLLPTSMLRWFMSMCNEGPSTKGVGKSPSFKPGAMVFGYFVDSLLQNGFVMGSFPAMPAGESDINKLARGIKEGTLISSRSPKTGAGMASGGSWDEPKSPYAATYPNNEVKETESGHVQEFDDTPGAERVHLSHRTGTFYEMHPDGSMVVKIVRDGYTIIAGDGYFSVDGNSSGSISGNHDLNIEGNNDINIDGENVVTIGGSSTVDIANSETVNIANAKTVTAKSITYTADLFTINANMVINGNVTQSGNFISSGAIVGMTIDSAMNSLDLHGHNYTWTDPAGSGITSPSISL